MKEKRGKYHKDISNNKTILMETIKTKFKNNLQIQVRETPVFIDEKGKPTEYFYEINILTNQLYKARIIIEDKKKELS